MSFMPLFFAAILLQSVPGSPSVLPTARIAPQGGLLPMLIYFHSDACNSCAQFDVLFEKPELLQKLEEHYVAARVNIDNSEGKACADIYDIQTVPAFVVADHKGVILFKSDASLSVEDIRALLSATPVPYPSVSEISNEQTSAAPATEADLAENEISITGFIAPVEFVQSRIMYAALPAHQPLISPTLVAHVNPILKPEKATTGNEIRDETTAGTSDHLSLIGESTLNSTSEHLVKTSRPATQESRAYAIQLGYFSVREYAESLTLKARAKGMSESRIEHESHNNKPFFRILVGEFRTLSDAQQYLNKVHSLGFKGAIYRL